MNYEEVAVMLQERKQIYDADVQSFIDLYARAAGVAENGYLDYGEFLDVSIQLRKISHEEQVDRAFHFFDRNQSGYIELEELGKVLADEIDTNSKEVIKAIMQCLNTNKVSKILE